MGDIVAEGVGEGVATADDRCWEAVESVVVVDPEAIAIFGIPMFVGFFAALCPKQSLRVYY